MCFLGALLMAEKMPFEAVWEDVLLLSKATEL